MKISDLIDIAELYESRQREREEEHDRAEDNEDDVDESASDIYGKSSKVLDKISKNSGSLKSSNNLKKLYISRSGKYAKNFLKSLSNPVAEEEMEDPEQKRAPVNKGRKND